MISDALELLIENATQSNKTYIEAYLSIYFFLKLSICFPSFSHFLLFLAMRPFQWYYFSQRLRNIKRNHVSQRLVHISLWKKNKVVGHSSKLLLFCIWTVMSGKNTNDEKGSADLQSGYDKILLIIAIWFVNSCNINLTTIMTTEDHNFRVWQGRITPQMIQESCHNRLLVLLMRITYYRKAWITVFVSSFSSIPIL